MGQVGLATAQEAQTKAIIGLCRAATPGITKIAKGTTITLPLCYFAKTATDSQGGK